MGRPLRNEFINKISAHYVKEGAVVTGKLVKQVGFNKYKVEDGTIFRLCDREEVLENLAEGTGYVGVKIGNEAGYPNSLFKLTTHQAQLFDKGSFKFGYTFDVEDGKRTGITQSCEFITIQEDASEYDS